MRKLVYYVASTIDGYIAAPDGDASAFPISEAYIQQLAQEVPETFPGHVRSALGIDAPNARFDTVIMGRGTYDPALEMGITSPYPHLRQFVFSRSLAPSTDAAVTFVAGDPVPVVRDLKAEDTGKDIWLCGGGNLAGQLIEELDELIIKLNPLVLGAGIPLFSQELAVRRFALIESQPREGGVVLLRYGAAP
jgi:dihydrofolate reductase